MATDKPLIAIVGQTASGKTALAIELAKQFNGEIICADSRTVYKGLDIGTAKPTKDEQGEVPHHLLDVVNPDENFTVADFKDLAEAAIQDVHNRSKVPFLVGGSGLYIDAVLYDYQFADSKAPKDKLNPRHLDASVLSNKAKLRPNTLILGLKLEPTELKERIKARIEDMMEQGVLTEARWLYKNYPNSKAALTPGYKAFQGLTNRETTIDEVKDTFAQYDRHLAKRQFTWFKRNTDIHWLNNKDEAKSLLTQFLNNNLLQ